MSRGASISHAIVSLLLAAALCASCAKSSDGAQTMRVGSAPGVVLADSSAAMAPTMADSDLTRADRNRVQGNPNAKVWLIMASDFQCPYCKAWHEETYPIIVREYVKTGKIRLAYVNFPLVSIHPHAEQAAEAAMCASAQGKFWEMHDALFASQDTWAPMNTPGPAFDSLALEVGVNMTAWRHCVSTHAMDALVYRDRKNDSTAGVKSTPSFIIGNQILAGADKTFNVLRPLIEAALAKASSSNAPHESPRLH